MPHVTHVACIWPLFLSSSCSHSNPLLGCTYTLTGVWRHSLPISLSPPLYLSHSLSLELMSLPMSACSRLICHQFLSVPFWLDFSSVSPHPPLFFSPPPSFSCLLPPTGVIIFHTESNLFSRSHKLMRLSLCVFLPFFFCWLFPNWIAPQCKCRHVPFSGAVIFQFQHHHDNVDARIL